MLRLNFKWFQCQREDTPLDRITTCPIINTSNVPVHTPTHPEQTSGSSTWHLRPCPPCRSCMSLKAHRSTHSIKAAHVPCLHIEADLMLSLRTLLSYLTAHLYKCLYCHYRCFGLAIETVRIIMWQSHSVSHSVWMQRLRFIYFDAAIAEPFI